MAIALLSSYQETASPLGPSTAPPRWDFLTWCSLWTRRHGGLQRSELIATLQQVGGSRRGCSFGGTSLIRGGLWSLVSLSVVLAGLLPYQEPFQFPVPCGAASPVSGGRSSRRNSMGGFPASSVQPNHLFDLGQTLTFRGPLETWPESCLAALMQGRAGYEQICKRLEKCVTSGRRAH